MSNPPIIFFDICNFLAKSRISLTYTYMKSRRKFIQTLSMAGAAATLPLTSYGKSENTEKMIHQVFFWLKDGEDVQDFKKEASVLGKCKTVKSSYMGTPAPTEARDVVDNSYQLAVTLFFDSLKDQAVYQVDPDHLEFIERNSDRWTSVKVYDFMV